jgi:PAS domain S-box-containing protein
MKHMIKTKAQLLNEVTRLRKRIKINRAASNKMAKTVSLPFTELYNLLFNSINDEIFVYEYPNQGGVPPKFLEVNGVVCKQLEYTREELLQKGPYDIYAPETFSHVEAMMKKLKTQKYVVWEGIHLAKNGRRIPIEVSSHIFELKGKPTVISAVKDITYRKQAEEAQKQTEQAMRESEDRFRTLAEASFEGVALTENGVIVDMNDQLAHMYDYERNELIGKSLLDIIVPELHAHVKETIQLDKRESYEILGLRKNGTTFPAEVRGRFTRRGGKELYISTIRDITERKQTEETFQRERNILRTLIDNLPDAVYVKDTTCCKTIANRADVHNMGGQSEAEVLGKTDYDFYVADIAAAFYADDQSVIQTGQPILNKEEFFFDKDGKEHWLLTSKLPLRDDHGRITSIVGVGREITEQKHIEEALRHEKTLLDALMNNIPDSIYFKDRQCRLLRMNRKEMRDLNMDDISQIVGKTDVDLWGEEFGRKTFADEQRLMESGEPIIGLVESRQLEDGQNNWTWTTKVPLRDESGQIMGLVGITREINDLMKAQTERDNLITKLQNALADVKTLSGLVPICANCKQIRDDKGFWMQVESYIQERSQARFSHGICPDCMKKLYPEFVQKEDE